MNRHQPLEDEAGDVIRKAQAGLGVGDAALAEGAGVSAETLGEALAGRAGEAVYRALAGVLGLHGPSLAALAAGEWHPAPVALDGLAQVTTRFSGMSVNAYLLWDPATREGAAFDTGADAEPLFAAAAERGVAVGELFLTHSHRDHTAGLGAFLARGVRARCPEEEPVEGAEPFPAGAVFRIGGLRVEARPTPGHTRGGTSYAVSGLARGVAVVGDALFAGSMGGARDAYREALAAGRAAIFSLPDETLIAPGHGPMTTLAEEKAHNPFFPEFKAG